MSYQDAKVAFIWSRAALESLGRLRRKLTLDGALLVAPDPARGVGGGVGGDCRISVATVR